MKCPQCDFENEEGSKFCKNCNVPLSKSDYSEENPYTKKNIDKIEEKEEEEEEEEKIRKKIEREEEIRAEVRAEKAKIEKENKKKSSSAGCLVFLILAVAVYFIMFSPSSQKEETQSSIIHLNASVSFTGTQFIIKNNDNFDWLNVKMEVNGGLLKGGFIFKADSVKTGETYTVGALQFAKGDGTRLNPFVIKPKEFDIYCDNPKDKYSIASWHGDWE